MANTEIATVAVKMNSEGNPVEHITYAPNGTSHALQRKISEFMHELVKSVGKFTLSELGYLHINTLTYNQETGALNLRIYFDIRLAARAVQSTTNKSKMIVPVQELEIFKDYFYVGKLQDVVTYEKIMAPKTKVVEDEMHRASLQFKDSNKYIETDVLVLNCNLAITMAAIHDISLTDQEFTVRCSTVGKGGKNAVKSIITTANMKEVPVSVTIVHNANSGGINGYEPDDAISYLTALQEEQYRIAKNRDKVQQKVRKDAKDKKKSVESKNSKGFNKYS